MIAEILQEEKLILEPVKFMPSVSIILPFEPKMSLKRELEMLLQRVFKKVEKDLMRNYAEAKSKPVITKLNALLNKIDFGSYKKSIAIFVSPILEKIYYLDMPVEEKIIIDESFEVRNLVCNKKDIHQYLVLVVSRERSRIFHGSNNKFVRIAYNTPQPIGMGNDAPERVSNFTSPSERREMLLDKFLHHVDQTLGHILKAYALPLFVMGTSRTMGHFKKITHHSSHILGFIPGNFEDTADSTISKALLPSIEDWNKVKQADLLHQLDTAMGAKKVAAGIEEVWKQVSHNKGRLLVVERNYSCSAHHGPKAEIIYSKNKLNANPLFIKDAVDDIIEKVLENGGDVEFVDDGILEDFQHIALIQYY